MKVVIYTDGGARGNPGPGAFAYLLFDPAGREVFSGKEFLGVVTNNVAEYRAVIAALEEARRRGAREVELFTDSELVAKQLAGHYKVKQAHLAALVVKVRDLELSFEKVRYSNLPRTHERIARADGLVNEAIDEALERGR
jgi:ribonuclease HI